MLYICSQIVGFIGFIISLIAYHRDTKEKIFKSMIVANILDIVHYLLLFAYSGCATKVMALIRNIVIVTKEKIKFLQSVVILVIFIILYVLVGIFTYNGLWSILPVLAAIIYMIAVWNGDEMTVKKAAFACYFLWLAYNIFVFSIAGIVSNTIAIVSTFVAVKRESSVEREKTCNKV